jgi:hypothetical protein
MKKELLVICALFGAFSFVYGQGQISESATPDQLRRLDLTVKNLAADISRSLDAGGAQKVAVGQFARQSRIPELGTYWNTQLIQELSSVPDRSWLLLSGPVPDADFTISGEIVEIVNTVRVFTRIIRSRDHSVSASIQSDFERDVFIAELLSGGTDNGGRSASAARDAYENDSMGNPLTVELAAGDGSPAVQRTLHSSNDEDFFLLHPAEDGSMTIETTGSIDTLMALYDAETGNKITDDDDGGSSGNARIRRTVRAGSRYIAKVTGYDGATGSYGFQARLVPQVRISPDEYEEDDGFDNAKEISVGTAQQHTFHSKDDVDYVKFQITSAGRYTIRAGGVSSNRLDTYIELFSAAHDSIDDDDDSGADLDSRINRQLEEGTYYLKAECLDDEPDQPYTISIERN